MTFPRREDDNFDFNRRPQQRQTPLTLPAGQTTSRGRRSAPLDMGTVALAIGAMNFYWTLPALLSARKRSRRRAAPPSRDAQA